MVWSIDDDVWVERDDEGFATQLRHIQSPFSTGTTDPYDLAVDYLGAVKEELGLDRNQIDFLADPAHRPPAGQDWGDTNRKEGEWLRWRQRRDLRPWQEDGAVHFETTVLVLQQTHYVPLPPHLWFLSPFPDVFASGIRIVMHRRSAGELAVTGATSTLRHNFNLAHARALAATPSSPHGLADAVAAPAPAETAGIAVASPQHSFIDLIRQVLVLLGFSATKVPAEYDWVLYRYNARREGQQALHPTARFLRAHNRSNLVPDSDYPAIMVRISGRPTPAELEPDTPPIDLFVRFPDPAVLGVAPLMAGAETTADALVFPVDPITQRGYPWPPDRLGADKTLRPNRPAAELNPVRQSVTLERLLAPSGTPQMLKLRGDNVIVVEPGEVPIGTIGERPPAEPAGGSFEYDCRTNAFAAVNAYYHLDTMMQRLELFGLPFKEYAPTFDPTLLAIHRAAIRPGPGGDGRCVNAQVRFLPDEWSEAGSTPQHKLEFRFALADVAPRPEAEPLGIACDVRWVWHEFGHALIAGATGDLELPFVHSVGDGLAAINCDPGSALALPRYNDDSEEAAVLPAHARIHARGVTFPWVTLPNRRHDRKAADGWSWTQRLGQAAGYHEDQSDEAGYHREQVLSSTLFRLYRALGGDAIDEDDQPDDDRRRIAADYVTYLIVRAVGRWDGRSRHRR